MKIQLSDHFNTTRLLRFSLPSILMMIFTSIYGVVDGFFISNYVGKTSFAAVNIIFPFLMVLGAVGFMLGTGGSALIGLKLGQKENEQANRYFSMVVWVSLGIGAVLAILGLIFMRPAALLLGSDEAMLEDCVTYGRINMIGLPVLLLQFEFQSLFVTAEKPQLGLYVTLGAGFMNMILDYVLVGLLRWGIPGAAIATVMSQVVGGGVPLVYFFRKNTSLLKIGKPYFEGSAFLRICGNGASEFVSNISMSLVSILYNLQLMKYGGEDGVAAYGVLMYVNMIFLAAFIGYAVGTAPVVSYHFGAKDIEEVKDIRRRSLYIILTFAVLMLAAGELLGRPLSQIYVGYDEQLMHMTVHAFRIFSFTFLFAGIPIYGSSYFTALNNGKVSAIISFLRTVVFQALCVMLFPLIFGIEGIWFSLVAAEVIASAITIFFWIRYRNLKLRTEECKKVEKD